MKSVFIFLFLFTITSQIFSQDITTTTNEAKDYIDQVVTVEGIIKEVFISNKGTVFLNIDKKFPDVIFSAVIFNKDRDYISNLIGLHFESLIDKKVKITGKIILYRDKTEIIIKEKDQLEILE